MTDRTPPDADAAAREAARLAWERGELEKGDAIAAEPPRPIPAADDDFVMYRRRRAAYPPSFKLIVAACLAFLALEPTADLSYELFGPSEVIDLGEPTDFHLDRAVDGARAKIAGFASSRRGTYSKFPNDYEVAALAGTSVLVRRAPQPPAPPSSVELYRGEGRLLKLADEPGSFLERLVRPEARYGSVKSTFVTYGEIPPGRTAWMLLDGDVPRADPWAIGLPIALWILAIFLTISAVRALVRPSAPRARP